jgi:hypothetical protein
LWQIEKIMKNVFLLALVLMLGCKKSEPAPTTEYEYFIFGSHYGECVGDCALLFKLEGQHLFADDELVYFTSLAYFANNDLPFQSTSLSAEKVALAVALSEQMPTELFDESDGVIGCPDCRDQGGYFVKVKLSNGEVRFWNIDPDKEEYEAFCDAIRTAVNQM